MSPPTPITTYILLALAQADLTAPEIRRRIGTDSQSTCLPRDGAFYKALSRMQRDQLIAINATHIATSATHTYAITHTGHQHLTAEYHRIARLAQVLRNHL